jgi:hypothetical protein
MVLHPDKSRAQMLALSHSPPALRVYSLSTYKPLSTCTGFKGLNAGGTDGSSGSGGGVSVPFVRAQFSADGRFVICCVPATGPGGSAGGAHRAGVGPVGAWKLKVWDSQTGHPVHTPLSGKLSCLFDGDVI